MKRATHCSCCGIRFEPGTHRITSKFTGLTFCADVTACKARVAATPRIEYVEAWRR